MVSPETCNKVCSTCKKLVSSSASSQAVMGDAFGEGLEGIKVFDSALFEHNERGKIEINATRASARPPFEWLYEVTFRGDPFKHYLVQDNGKIVEAYAKNIIPVDQTGAEELLGILEQLT